MYADTSDIVLITDRIRFSQSSLWAEVRFALQSDGIAQEPDERFSISLDSAAMLDQTLFPGNVTFIATMNGTIRDTTRESVVYAYRDGLLIICYGRNPSYNLSGH